MAPERPSKPGPGGGDRPSEPPSRGPSPGSDLASEPEPDAGKPPPRPTGQQGPAAALAASQAADAELTPALPPTLDAATPPPPEGSGEEERRKLTGRAGVVAAGTLLSRILGLGRELVLAAMFARAATDAFFVAFTIPNVLRQLLAEGAMQNAVLPVLTKTREQEGEEAARELYRRLRGLSLLVLTLVTIAGVLAAPWLVELYAGGFRDHPGQFERTVHLTRWVFPFIFFMGTAALGVAALNTHRRFVVAAFAPALVNVAFIVFALALPAWLLARGHEPILAMAVGALVGGALQVLAQWPSLKKIGYFAWPRLDLLHRGVREVLRRMGPVMFGIGVYFVDVLIARRLLSEGQVGAQSYFSWAMRLCDLPQGVFVMALQTATLPSLALLFARGEKHEVEKTFAYGMRLALFVGLAASALLVVLAEPLVVLLFQRGQFDAVAARETSHALIAQGLGVWTVAAVRQLVAVYYAVGDTRTPAIVAAIDLCVFIALALSLRGPLGHVGISLAVSGASAAQMLLLWAFLGRRLEKARAGEVTRSAVRTLLAIAPAAAAGWITAQALDLGQGPLARMLPGAGGALVFGAVFLGAAALLKSDELATIVAPVRRRLRRGH